MGNKSEVAFPTFGARFLVSNSKGYTLIELIIVIALIGILITLSFVSLNSANQREQTRSVTDGIRSELRSGREDSLANKIATSGLFAGQPAGYYGILFLNGSVVTNALYSDYWSRSYAVIRVEKGKNLNCSLANCGATVIRTVTFPNGVQVATNSPGKAPPYPAVRAVLFHQFDGAASLYDNNGAILSPVPPTFYMTIYGTGNNQLVTLYPGTGRIE
jgi:prepilin-type N-terminal cleavage/methylation domain-containing protein